jgi:hypothetical protein
LSSRSRRGRDSHREPNPDPRRDQKGGSKWAPFVVFGGILAIALTGVTIVLASDCNRSQPYLDPIKVPYDPNHVPVKPKPVRPVRPELDLFN